MTFKNNIEPFKNRTIDFNKPVRVFRNLHKKGRWYSIQQKNKTVAHTNNLLLENCELIVNEKTRQRVVKTGKKEVHAYVKGFIANSIPISQMDFKLEYDPFKNKNFILTFDGEQLVHYNKIRWISFNDNEGLKAQI